MTNQEFLTKELKDISQVYLGKRNHCRCGCGGTYTSTSYADEPRRSDVDDKLVERRLKRAKKLVEEGGDVDSFDGANYFDVETGNNRCLTFYFDDLKEQKKKKSK